MPPLEIEVKLGLPTPAAYEALRAALGEATRVRLQRNAFFDGPRQEVSLQRIALRVREERSRSAAGESIRTLVTLKGGGTASGAVHARIEWEAEIPHSLEEVVADPSLLLRLSVDPVRELRRAVPGLRRLVCLGGFDNERREVSVPLEIRQAAGRTFRVPTIWELDRTTFGSGPVEQELEVELPAAGRAQNVSGEALADAVKDRLANWGIPWFLQPSSKYARFRRYCLGRQD